MIILHLQIYLDINIIIKYLLLSNRLTTTNNYIK
jgi:hypothetical protein